MKLRQMLAGFVALSAGALIVAAPGTSLAAGFQNSPNNFQSASLPPTQTVPQFSSQTPATNMVRPDYIIGPDDVISVDVFQIPDLSRTVQVDSEGNILLPLLGSVPAGGRSVSQLSKQVAAAYGDKYVRDPKVTVSVKESESQKVTVNGAVIQPGIYPISSGTTLMQAIALAKGPDTKLASDRVAIFRTVGQNRTQATFDISDIQSGKVPDPQLQAHDIVVVDTSGTRKFLQDISPIAPFAVLGAIF
ncbi:MAG TPA: polysaccharide biosynthesis/export family protein [Stellaceae bacterium]|jgi:polysaccharide export outer membrane protein|nr:polysaccharide biosynthesis/export family protein [Stellaceae bacterium]